MVALNGMPDKTQQRNRLLKIKELGGYGILAICDREGDVLFAASPVPNLLGYEIVSASPEPTYDIWKDGQLVTPNQTLNQVHEWIKTNTPVWLYDDSVPTMKQARTLQRWIYLFAQRYHGVLTVG